jgi:hypothetical protein
MYGTSDLTRWGVEHPPLPKKRPKLYRYWWFWRFYGYVFYILVGKAWRFFSYCRYNPCGGWKHRFKIYPAVREWLWGTGTGKALVDMPIRYRLKKLLMRDYYCPHCGDEGFLEDEAFVGETDESITLFECTDSGEYGGPDGTVHWWEGWMWCYRCGHYEWYHDST